MHQTSSRLLRMTKDDRPFARDFKDLFSTLMVSLPLNTHRVLFQRIDHSFTSEEAVTNLGSLKFSQSNRMPDPKDATRIVTTTATTTFSMSKDMARSVCHKFLEARFVESCDGKMDFSLKSAVWRMTPKGIHVLQRFCQRNGINQRHVTEVLESSRNVLSLVILEREVETDALNQDEATIGVIFRRFIGPDDPSSKQVSDSDSVNGDSGGMSGVRMFRDRRNNDRRYCYSFTGKAAVDWLMDCCTVVHKNETLELCNLFIKNQFIQQVDGINSSFQPTKNAIYVVTEKGKRTVGWIEDPRTSLSADATGSPQRLREGMSRDSNSSSNTSKMDFIIRDPALRLVFREYLRDTHCEENLSFYLEVSEFLGNYASSKNSNTPRLSSVKEILATAYSLYNAYLAPGSPGELNIDYTLRTALANRMTRAVSDDEAMIKSVDEVATLFDKAQSSVFKLMASDSVPKFIREPKYSYIIRERDLDRSS